MKKILLPLIVLCACLSAGAQPQQAKITVFQKEAPPRGNYQIVLNTVSNGQAHRDENASAIENGDGSYTFELAVEEPVIRYVGALPVYISGGDDITVGLTRDGYEIVEGRVSPENRAFMEWVGITRRMNTSGTRDETYQEYFARFEEMVRRAAELDANLDTGNTEFDEKFRRAMRYEMDNIAIQYKLMTNSSATREDYPDYYDTILTPGRFDDDLVMSLPFGNRYVLILQTYFRFENELNDRDEFLKLIANPAIRNMLLFNELQYIPSASEMSHAIEKYAHELDEENIRTLKGRLNRIMAANDREAKEFTFPDVDGNMVSLSDFRGKIVLIDVWATWCGPCMYQLPYLAELEEKFHDNPDIVFMGISTDKMKDYDKWAEMVRDGQVKGIQLFTDGGGQFSRDYFLNGIPRFIVIGRDGKFVEFDAPRPSNPLLEQLLTELSAK